MCNVACNVTRNVRIPITDGGVRASFCLQLLAAGAERGVVCLLDKKGNMTGAVAILEMKLQEVAARRVPALSEQTARAPVPSGSQAVQASQLPVPPAIFAPPPAHPAAPAAAQYLPAASRASSVVQQEASPLASQASSAVDFQHGIVTRQSRRSSRIVSIEFLELEVLDNIATAKQAMARLQMEVAGLLAATTAHTWIQQNAF